MPAANDNKKGQTAAKLQNRIAAVAMVRDEADIIESFVRHIVQIADVVLLTDHHSTDGTREILASLMAEGLPLLVEDFADPGYHQEAVMTHMMVQAVREQDADLVLLLDADEFPVAPDGDAGALRTYLQALPLLAEPGWYRVPWYSCEPAEPEENRSKFLLSRPLLRAPQPEDAAKAIACRSAVEKFQLSVYRGSHALITPQAAQAGGLYWDVPPTDADAAKMQILHVPIRSEKHFLAKYLTDWLTWAARSSVYASDGGAYHRAFLSYLRGEKPAWPHVKDAASVDLSAYAEECSLRYTKETEIDPLANVLRLAEHLATARLRDSLHGREPGLSLVIICEGPDFRIEWLDAALTHAKTQGYPLTQLLAVAGEAHFSAVQGLLQNRVNGGNASLLPLAEIAQLSRLVQAPYVQLLLPGDVMLPGRWQEMMLCLALHPQVRMACADVLDAAGTEERLAPPASNIWMDLPAQYFPASQFRTFFLRTGSHLPFTLGSAIFRYDVFQSCGFLGEAARRGKLRQLSTWMALLDIVGEEPQAIALLARPFLRQAHAWSKEEYGAYLDDWEQVLQQFAGSGALPEDAEASAREALAKERERLATFGEQGNR